MDILNFKIKYYYYKEIIIMENKINDESELRLIFGRRLKRLREDCNLTLMELSQILFDKYSIEVTYQSLGNYESKGYRLPSIWNLTKIAEFFNVTTEYLTGRTDLKNAVLQQVNLFDKDNKAHVVEIAVDKDVPLKDRPFSEIQDLIKQLKELGFDYHM